jgi:hypothetical protein
LKRFRKIIFYALGLLLFILIALSVLLYLYQDRIIQHVVAQANKSLKTPVRVDKIEVNWWTDFPSLSVVCKNVYIEDSHPEEAPLFLAKRISFSFNVLELWRGQYSIQRISVYQSETFIKVNKKGEGNYDITKKASEAEAFSFRLNRITLKDAWVSYQDASAQHDHRFATDQLVASLSSEKEVYNIQADGQLRVEQIGVGENQYLVNKDFGVKAQVVYDDLQKEVRIDSSRLQQKDTRYQIAGRYQFKEAGSIDLQVRGTNANVQSLLAFLPARIEQQLAAYESKGEVYFRATLKGSWREKQSPALQVDFGWNEAELYHPEFKSRMEDTHLEGRLVMPALHDLTRARLTLDSIRGKLNGRELTARLQIDNFREAFLTMDFNGIVAADFVNSVYRSDALAGLTGTFAADLHYAGPLGTWSSPAPPMDASGSLQFQDVAIEWKQPQLKLAQLNGLVGFNRVDVSLSNFSGRVGSSDFVVNGLFRNIVNYVANPAQPVQVEAELQARYLNVDELLDKVFTSEKNGSVQFGLDPRWTLNFNCQIDHLRFKKFNARYLAGDLQIRNQLAVSRNVQMKTLGGEVTFNGIVDAQQPAAVDVVGGFQLNKVHLDSIFYVFENFGQTFIEAKHLKGRVEADVSLELTLTEALKLKSETLIADVSATIRQGELNNFEPLQKLSRYLDDEGLSKLRFADLTNEIHIENQTVYIPQMEIRSNVTTLQLSGTHTFSQHIDYRVVAPLRNKKKIDPDEAFGAIEEAKGQSRVFLKITGTTDQYEVSYDKSAVKQKITSDLKKEVKELKDAFRLKGKQKKKELELSEEEFDWQ